MAVQFRDYYETLGVPKTASEDEIRSAFRKLARKYHPDVAKDKKTAEEKFKEINEAYEVLGDPDKRKKYDELGANWRMYEQADRGAAPGGQGFPGGWNVNFGGGAPGGGGYRTMTEEEMREMFGDGHPFSDFFETFFGGGGGFGGDVRGGSGRGGRARARAGRDIEQEIQLDLEDAYHGALRRLSMRLDGQ